VVGDVRDSYRDLPGTDRNRFCFAHDRASGRAQGIRQHGASGADADSRGGLRAAVPGAGAGLSGGQLLRVFDNGRRRSTTLLLSLGHAFRVTAARYVARAWWPGHQRFSAVRGGASADGVNPSRVCFAIRRRGWECPTARPPWRGDSRSNQWSRWSVGCPPPRSQPAAKKPALSLKAPITVRRGGGRGALAGHGHRGRAQGDRRPDDLSLRRGAAASPWSVSETPLLSEGQTWLNGRRGWNVDGGNLEPTPALAGIVFNGAADRP